MLFESTLHTTLGRLLGPEGRWGISELLEVLLGFKRFLWND